MINNIVSFFESVEIQRFERAENEWGDLVEEWTTYKTVQGRLRQLNSKEQLVSGKDNIVSTHRLYSKDTTITHLDRVVYRDKAYEILSVNDVMNFGELQQIDLRLVI